MNFVLMGISAALLVAYLARRRSRLRNEDA